MPRLLKLLAPSIILLLSTLGAWGYYTLNKPVAHNKANEYIQIPKGTATQEIAAKLNENGIITQQWSILLYLKLTGLSTHIKAGDYKFPSPISPLQVAAKLQEGQQKLLRLTVIEGWSRWEIAQAMARLPELRLKNSEEALKLMDNTTKIKDLDATAKNLEGYLYPDTYFFPAETTASEIINLMVERTRQEWTAERINQARSRNLTPRQALTVASMIETEAKLTEERPLVASVIYNRIRLNIPLGIDSTIIYASKLAGKWKNDGKVYQSDLGRISPYNTRRVTGLPPGPIAASSSTSLSAALNPANTNYIFYVRNPERNDGTHNFYDNNRDFQVGVQALRKWEQRQKAQ